MRKYEYWFDVYFYKSGYFQKDIYSTLAYNDTLAIQDIKNYINKYVGVFIGCDLLKKRIYVGGVY